MSNKQWGLIGILVTLNKKTAFFETVFFYCIMEEDITDSFH